MDRGSRSVGSSVSVSECVGSLCLTTFNISVDRSSGENTSQLLSDCGPDTRASAGYYIVLTLRSVAIQPYYNLEHPPDIVICFL